jgi:hypothetical protein
MWTKGLAPHPESPIALLSGMDCRSFLQAAWKGNPASHPLPCIHALLFLRQWTSSASEFLRSPAVRGFLAIYQG